MHLPDCTCTPELMCAYCAEYLPPDRRARLCRSCGNPRPERIKPEERAKALAAAIDRARALERLGLGSCKVCGLCLKVLSTSVDNE